MQGYLRYYLAKIFLGSPNLCAPWGTTADTHLVFKLGYTKITLQKSPRQTREFLLK